MLNYVQHFISVNFVVFFIVVKLAALHDQVVHLQLASGTLNNLFFNSALCNKSVDNYVSLLADSVCSVDCLQINLRVPVAIEDNDNVG